MCHLVITIAEKLNATFDLSTLQSSFLEVREEPEEVVNKPC